MIKSNLEFLMYQTNLVPFRAPTHTHTCYELVYYIEGTGTTEINGLAFHYQPGIFSIIEPKLNHNEAAKTDTDIIYIGFSVGNIPFHLESGVYNDNEDHSIYQTLCTMKNELLGKAQYYNERLNILTQDILVMLGRIAPNSESGTAPKDDNLLYAINYLDLNFAKGINLQTLADITGYSYDYFRHIFKSLTGLSPMQYIMDKRINLSKNLLADTDETVTAIAYKCFFASNSQFIKIFRQTTGMTPLQYRQHCKMHEMNIKLME